MPQQLGGAVVKDIVARYRVIEDPRNKATQAKIRKSEKEINRLLKHRTAQQAQLNMTSERATAVRRKYNNEIAETNRLLKNERAALKKSNEAYKMQEEQLKRNTIAAARYTTALTLLAKTTVKGIKINLQYIATLNAVNVLFDESSDNILN